LITTAKAPITLMLLFWFSLLFVIVIYILFVQQTGSFATMRRLTKELQEQRKLATDQEASRLTDVKADFEKKWQVWMEEQKQILSQTEQRLTERQNKILEAFKGAEDQIAAANKELNTSISGTLDTMDDKITKILIANKNPDQQ
jgi:biopolymer transport protein ExbB/TolQ